MNQRDGHVMTTEQVDAALAVQTGPKVQPEDLEAAIVGEQYHQWPGMLLITCVLTLKNGFNVSGESACASAELFNEEIGKGIARRNAKDKLWSLLGYQLKEKLHLMEVAGPAAGKIRELGEPVTYVGTKVVHAVPMGRLDYNTLRGWAMPADEVDEPGYLVQYADGGESNVEGFGGYISWSPQDVFERAYTTGVTLKETTYVERMVKELDELTTRTDALGRFILTQKFTDLPEKKRMALRAQHTAMVDYQWHLGGRLRDEMPNES